MAGPSVDCHLAIREIMKLQRNRGIPGPAIAIGHSVGGQLALLNSQHVDAVVALAPVTDVVRTFDEGAGEDAAREYFRVAPPDAPEMYRDASAIAQLPTVSPTLVVHGADDARVAVAHSRDYVRHAQHVGSAVRLLELEHLDHLSQIDPAAAHWHEVLGWMAAQGSTSGAAAPRG